MSPRQARRERREADRKAKKAETRRMKGAGPTPPPDFSSELEAEFSPEFLAEARSARERVWARVANSPEPANERPTATRSEINRANAQHSTGPRTQIGKLASSRNSLRHGLASSVLIIPGEDPAAFEALKTALLEEHQAGTETEILLVTEMAQSWWLAQRAIRFQNDCFTANGVEQKQLALFLRYQTTHERALHKALTTLMRLQKDRCRTKSGFVSQSSEFVRQNSPSTGFVSQNAEFAFPLASETHKKNQPSQHSYLTRDLVARTGPKRGITCIA